MRHNIPNNFMTLLAIAFVTAIALTAPASYRDGEDEGVRVRLAVSDEESLRAALAAGGRLVEDYGGFQYVEVDSSALTNPALAQAASSADASTIELNSGPINTRVTPSYALSAAAAADPTKRLHLVQFAGPIKPEWYESLTKQGLQIVTYIPNNAYLVYGTGAQRAAISSAVAKAAPVQWSGEFLPEHRIHPRIAAETGKQGKARAEPRLFAIQMVEDADANLATMALINRLAVEPPLREWQVLVYRNVIVRLPVSAVDELAKRPEVVSIAPYVMPTKNCERQNQIVAGNLAGNVPSGPGYLSWLTGKGFTQAQFDASNFVVDVCDSGIDNGTNSPNHFGLRRLGETTGTSRVVYARLEGTPNSGSTIQGCDGHGTIDAHIVAGYSNLSGFPHADGSGYRYGLGVAPFVNVGSSTVFDPDSFTSPNYTNMLSRAYRDGARISTNSWGADVAGLYEVDCQEYDALVRDSQPAGSAVPAAGNQEMVIVFANGNAGPNSQTVGSPATAKNVISVGAAESVQAFGGADGCGVADTGANSANDIIAFSSRGPCADGRIKPEIVAPGTHVSGGVAQAASPGPNGTALACYDGDGVCGGVSSIFFPNGQEFYTASSGTSHACPAVAGGCALLRQYFINQSRPVPSPAMTKAYLANSARYMTGTGANDTLWSNSQGMGMMNLGMAFDDVARILSDQDAGLKFTASGQTRNWTVSIPDASKPFRVTLAWTDAPGNTVGAAYNNDLELTVFHGGGVYRGNVFSGATSSQGGPYDPRNNMESVFLPAGTTGTAVVRVTAKNINSDGVPNVSPSLDQDFALVIYNASLASGAVPVAVSAGLVAESCVPGNFVVDPNETVEVALTVENVGNLAATNVQATLLASGNVVPKTGPVSYGNLAAGASATRNHRFRAVGNPGQTITVNYLVSNNGNPVGTASFTYRLCSVGNASTTYSYTGPAVAIPDNNPAGVNVPLTVSGFPMSIAKLRFRFDGSACSTAIGDVNAGLDHTWVSDLVVTLRSPQGTVVTLIDRTGGDGNNFCQTVLDDDAAVSIQAVSGSSAPFSGTYRPNAPLSAFVGENPNGTWTLNVSDRAGLDTGSVRRFSLLISTWQCCPSMAVTDEDGFESNPSQPPGSPTGWSIFGMNTPAFAFGQYAGPSTSLQSVVASHATKFRVSGWLANQAEWLPYASVGADKYVRGKFYLFAGGQSNPAEQNQIPCLRARLSNRFAVNSMLEVFGHLNSDPASVAHYAELRPSNVATSPSLYRVDMDPLDVPYLVANGATEGILRGFETYALDPQDNGYIALAESVIGTYPAAWTSTTTAASQTYTTATGNAGALALVDSILFSAFALIPGASEGDFATDDPNGATPRPTHSEGAFGVTLNATAVPTNRIGVAAREIFPGSDPALYPRVEENKQYHIRWHLTSTQNTNRNAAVRLRARSAKFGWSQKKEIGGAWATGGSTINENNSIAQQALPGVGTQNPDKYTTDTLGGWYTLIMHTPMSSDIRPEFAPGTPLSTRMPLMVAEPGPGSASLSRRDIRLGFDLVDTLSGGTNRNLEQGHVTLDRIEVRPYNLVSD